MSPPSTQHEFFLPLIRDDPKSAAIAKTLDQTAAFVGAVLTLTATAELAIGNIIADCFAHNEDERDLMFSLLIDPNLKLVSKGQILMHILKTKFNDLAKAYPDLEESLEKMRELRNRCAHSFPNATDEFIEKHGTDAIGFIWHAKGIRHTQELTYDEAQGRVRAIAKTVLDLETIREKIGEKMGHFPPV